MKEAHGDHKDDLEFEQTVSSLGKAEAQAKEIVGKASEGAERELREAREKAELLLEGGREEAVSFKNKLLSDSKKKIESEQSSIIKKAEKEASELEKKKLKPEDIKKLAASVFE